MSHFKTPNIAQIPGKPVKLHSHYTGSGRFGMTMVKLGDINSDSYNGECGDDMKFQMSCTLKYC